MDKQHRQELKTPDQFWQASKQAVTWMNSQLVPLVVALVLLFIGIVGGIYYVQLQKKREGEAQFHFGLAKSYYEQWKLAKPEEQSKTVTSLQAELDLLNSKYSSSRSNGLASLFRADLLAAKGNFSEAITFLEKYRDKLPSADQDLALMPMAKWAEEGKLWPKALETYERVLGKKESLFLEDALQGKARVLRNLDRKADAIKTYETFLEKYPSSQDAASVRGLLAELKAAAPKP